MKNLRGIQTVRAILANLVVVYHCFGIGLLPKYGFQSQFRPMTFLINAPPVVDLFLCISGFIVFYGYSNVQTSGWDFLKARIIRIVPIYWLVTLGIFFANSILTSQYRWIFLFQNLTFTVNLNKEYPLLASGWTLQYIMLFYVLFALALACVKKYRLLFISVLLLLIIAINPSTVITSTSIIIEFAVGGVAYYLFNSSISDKYHKSLVIVSVAFIIFTLTFHNQDNMHNYRGLIFAIPNLMIVLHMAKIKMPKYSLQLAGEYSFSLYLVHFPLLSLLFKVSSKFLPASTPGWFLIVTFVCISNFAAYYFWRYVETPITKILKTKITRR